MRIALLLLLAAACHKDANAPAPGAPANTGDTDALWKLAPEGVKFGAVASPRALQFVEHAYGDVHAFLATMPELAGPLKTMSEKLTKQLGTDQLSFAALGLSTTKSGAMFMRDDKRGFVVVPLGDRATFLKLIKGTQGADFDTIGNDTWCKTAHDVYICASDKEMFDLIGKGHIDAGAASARGDVEVAGNDLPVGGKDKITFATVLQLAPGQVTLRGAVVGVPPQALALMGPASKPRIEGDKTTGFALVHVKPLLATLPVPTGDIPGVNMQDLVKTIEDPITMTSQSSTLDVTIGLSDSGPWKAMIEICGKPELAAMGAKLVAGTCSFPIPNMPGVIVDVWVDGKALHVGKKQAATGNSFEASPLGKELATSEWQDAFYGRGSILAAGTGMWNLQTASQGFPPEARGIFTTMVRAMTTINEVGVGVRVDGSTLKFVLGMRTIWANPPATVAKVFALGADDIVAGKGADVAKGTQTPLENDIKAGYPGLMVPSALVGAMGAVAIPAFMDYMKKSKKTEAQLILNKIGKSLKRSYAETAAFPIGDGALLPAKACCGQPQNKCAPDPAAFAADKVWAALEMSIDEPTTYQYRYHSTDGKTAVVEAIGDLDCDGQAATYTMTVTSDNQMPKIDIVPPQPGVY